MRKSKSFDRVIFTADVLIAARDLLVIRRDEAYQRSLDRIRSLDNGIEVEEGHFTAEDLRHTMRITRPTEKWTFDDSVEFLAELRTIAADEPGCSAYFTAYEDEFDLDLTLTMGPHPDSRVEVSAPTRAIVQEIFEVFESAAAACAVPGPPEPASEPPTPLPPVVFIGHGHSTAWRDLKDHLTDKHGIDVEAYETGSRSGHAVRDVLAQMMNRASLALLVMTGEDETGEGGIRARQNVVHEAGLFQGKLGFERAVVLVEQGVEVFSNLDGVDQIRFPEGAISQTYGDVLAWIKRETTY